MDAREPELRFDAEVLVGERISRELAVEMVAAAKDLHRIHESCRADGIENSTGTSAAYLFAVWPELGGLIETGALPVTVLPRAARTRTDINNGSVMFGWTVGEDRVTATFITPNWTALLTLREVAGQQEAFGAMLEAFRRDHQ